jgi:hypothetical protein
MASSGFAVPLPNMDIASILDVVLGAIATIATVIAAYLAWRQYRRPDPSEMIAVGEKVTIYLTRAATVAAFAAMLDSAPSESLVFGQCKSCKDYPETFYQAILRASARGVRFRFIANPGSEGREFSERIRAIGTMEVRFKYVEGARTLGVKDREALTVISGPVGYIGLYLRDAVAARQQYQAFEPEWNASEPYDRREYAQ